MIGVREGFRTLSGRISGWVGSPWFFAANVVLVAVWLASGPFFHWGDTWQLVMTTGLTVTTQLLVILVQSTQNRDDRAVHLKLDELLRAVHDARTELAGAEDMAEDQVEMVIEEIKEEGSG